MSGVKGRGHMYNPVCFSFNENQSNLSWHVANSVFVLENINILSKLKKQLPPKKSFQRKSDWVIILTRKI